VYGTYMRLRLSTSASNRDVVRAARNKVAREALATPSLRTARHAFYMNMLEHHRQAQHLHLYVITGKA